MTSTPFLGDPLGFRGKRIIETHHASLLQKLPSIRPKTRTDPNLPDPLDVSDDVLRLLVNEKVGVLGAGIGGLYTALILDSLDIPYEILEGSDRTGGRLSTYWFKGEGHGPYDYYEEGAMRFPLPKKDEHGNYKNGVHKRLAELTEYGPLNQDSDPLREKLIPFYFAARSDGKPCFYYFNGVHQPATGTRGSFKAERMGVSAAYIKAGSDAIQEDVINPFARALIDDLVTGGDEGWKAMMENDAFSPRGYMASKYIPSESLKLPPTHLPTEVINWCNLLQDSTGGYNVALTESVFEALAFADVDYNNYGDVEWKCFRGGTETLPNKIVEYLESKGSHIIRKKRVTAIREDVIRICIPTRYKGTKVPSGVKRTHSESGVLTVGDDDGDRETLDYPNVVVTANGSETFSYGHVISTLPLTVLRTVDLRDAGLNIMQRNALRALSYGPAVKIAVRFGSNWWWEKLGIIGGQSYTDLPIRTIVYPSYGVDSTTPSTVLIASYTFTSDAARLSALSGEDEKEVLKELVLRNLAEAHYGVNGNEDITYQFLKGDFREMHVKDWLDDPRTMGAFAEFSPGEFETLYPALNRPAAHDCLHFAGEAVSTRHAFVVGALDSAWKAVYEYLLVTDQKEKIITFKQIWGENSEWASRAPLAEEGTEHDLLEQHIALTKYATLGGIIQ